MAQTEKRGRTYRARYYDPLGRRHSKTFTRKADAERYLREMHIGIERGNWLDPRDAETTLQEWSEEFLSLTRRLSGNVKRIWPHRAHQNWLHLVGHFLK